MSKILSYVDNVVSLYDSDESQAEYPNLSVTIKGDIESLVTQNGSINTLKLATDNAGNGGYQLPNTMPSNGDFLIYNGQNFVFQNFDVSAITLDNIGDFQIDRTNAGNGNIAYFYNNNVVVDRDTESSIIDGKTNALFSALKNTDRLLISIDSPGSGTSLYKLTLVELQKYLQTSLTSVISINNSDTDTSILANNTQIEFEVYNGVSTQQSLLTTDGLKISGDSLLFHDPTENTPASEFNVLSNGFQFVRYANTVNFSFEGTHNLIVNPNTVQFGANLLLDNGSSLNITNGAALQVDVSSTIDQDLSKTSSSDVLFTTLNVTSTNNATAVGTGAFQVDGGASIADDLFVGNNVIVNGQSVLVSSETVKENIMSMNEGMDYIMQLKPRSYNRKNTGKYEYGFIAEEVETIAPHIVNSASSIKGIEYTQFIPILVSALQAQNNKIIELENRINN